MGIISGLTSATPSKLLLDAGAFYLNYDFSKTLAQQASGALIGATSGGGSFSAVPTVRKIAVDGAKENVKQLQKIDQWVVTMVANVKEVTANNLIAALGAASSAVIASGDAESAYIGDTKITGNSDFASTDYKTNLTWVGRLSGTTAPVIITIDNPLCLNGLSITMKDKDEAVIPITVTGHYDLTDLETPPFKIIYPHA